MQLKYFFFLIFLPLLLSCYDKSEREQDLLDEYLENNNIDTPPKSSGLYYIEKKEGTGKAPKRGSYVTIMYRGKFIDGEVFDESDADGFIFRLGYGMVVTGLDEGVSYMREGGIATLIIPSFLGYGTYRHGDIPAYSTLIFEVKLIEIGNL